MAGPFLLDSMIVSEIIKPATKPANAAVLSKFAAAMSLNVSMTISGIVEYEIRRGLLAVSARKQLQTFEQFLANIKAVPVTEEILRKGAELWAEGKKTGQNPTDSDILIAATAIVENKILVTRNVKHFVWINGLQVDNWFDP